MAQRAAALTGYATSKLARIRSATTAAELHALRRAAWVQQGVLSVQVDAVENAWERQVLENLGSRLYGPRIDRGAQDGFPQSFKHRPRVKSRCTGCYGSKRS